MPRRPTRNVPTVIIPGWQGSGEGHWQTWLAAQLTESDREVRYPAFTDVDNPVLDDWLSELRACLDGLADDSFDVVAHSLGAVLWLHHVQTPNESPRAARVLLVAPPSPSTTIAEIAAFFPAPIDIDAVRHSADGTVLVGSSNDPYTPEGMPAAYGSPLKMATTIVENAGHFNTESGFGPWPNVLDWCGRDNLAFF